MKPFLPTLMFFSLLFFLFSVFISPNHSLAVGRDIELPPEHERKVELPGEKKEEAKKDTNALEEKSIPLSNPLCLGAKDCPRSTVEGIIKAIVNFLIIIATPIAALMIMVAAYQMLFAGGDPEKISQAKQTILYTVIGYVIILIGWGVTSIIQDILQ